MDALVIGMLALAAATVLLFVIQLVILIYLCRLKKTVERGMMGNATSEVRKRRWKEVYNATSANGMSALPHRNSLDEMPLNDVESLSSRTNSVRSDGLVMAFESGLTKVKDIRDGTYKTARIKS